MPAAAMTFCSRSSPGGAGEARFNRRGFDFAGARRDFGRADMMAPGMEIEAMDGKVVLGSLH